MAKVYGNPAVDGDSVYEAQATSVEYGDWTFEYHGPADIEELREMIQDDATAKSILRHVLEDLKTDARGKAWGDMRTANQVKVQVDGKVQKVSKAMATELQKLRQALEAAKANKA